MIQFFYENLPETVNTEYTKWLEDLIISEGKKPGEINYIFSDDEYLLKVNQDYLQHDYYTDIITFDYVKGKTISGEIFVSLQRISDNASTLSKSYEEELRRVLAHGVLHLCGYKDKTEEQEQEMRRKEDVYLAKYLKEFNF
ncbi:rRNA maturation RNase YbeY [uncultured Chryseobacterium sp.]|jgi:metalloprotein, YbeY/UPF0054 family|uniref:rRNA maturation RNase YbeY n=1 Tax=uncultured Chryseobacterium sp. TaxID=259322 RepID=UPI00260FB407|nr:rRNA maturation RNase YbeY [uncultured Chryseobacterium sp.]